MRLEWRGLSPDHARLGAVLDVGRPLRQCESVESLLPVPVQAGHCADQEGDTVPSQGRGQQPGQEAVLVGHVADVPPGVPQGRHHVAQAEEPQVDSSCGSGQTVAGSQVTELEGRGPQDMGAVLRQAGLAQFEAEEGVGPGLGRGQDVQPLVPVEGLAGVQTGQHLGDTGARDLVQAGQSRVALLVVVYEDAIQGV